MEKSLATGFLALFFVVLGFCYYVSLPSDPLSLPSLTQSLNGGKLSQVRPFLVAHRGFHYANDDIERPLENTLSAYEHAWSAGVLYCECDVMITKDFQVVLSHDENLKRLALRPEKITHNVVDSYFTEGLEWTPLKDGARVPLLSEVLSAGKRISKDSKLIVELKGEEYELAKAVAGIVSTDLGEHVEIVMSFSFHAVSSFSPLNPRKGKILSMLITVTQSTSREYFEFSLDSNLDSILTLLAEYQLDGLYVQYEERFLTDPRFVELCSKMVVGVWGVTNDKKATTIQLQQLGAKFINTDFPDEYFA